MPLLHLEPFVFPENLLTDRPPSVEGVTLPGPGSGAADGLLPDCPPLEEAPCWWVLHTKSRQEKCLARFLVNHSISFFLPLYHRQWRNQGRLFRSYAPLFTGYMFLYSNPRARLEAVATKWVVRCLKVPDQVQLRTDLERVYRVMASGAPLWPEDRLQPGRWVEITCGAMAGLQGKILRKGKRLKFFVEVHMLQCGVTVEVEDWMIQPVAEPSVVL